MPETLPTLELYPTADPRALPYPDGFAVAATAISALGEATRLFVRKNSATEVFGRTEEPGWASFPKTQANDEYTALLYISDEHADQETSLKGLTATFPKVQLLPDRETLVVGPRCKRFKDGTSELNGTVYDSQGNLKRSFVLGDGIEDVQADRKGNIWVSYFDEGVFGNFGWGGDAVPFGASGLTYFDLNGKRLWDFQAPSGFDSICDCYALNVAKDSVWAHYYSDFPIVRIDASYRVRGWRPDSGGARALAVHDRRVLLFGNFSGHPASCKLLELRGDSAESIARVRLMLPEAVDLSGATVVGRDNEIHVVSGNDWYSFSMWALP